MKKILLSIGCLVATSMAFAGGNEAKKELKSDDGILSNGFYLNIGIGLPNTTMTSYDGNSISPKTQSLGTQINLEIGNQFYFSTRGKMGIGLKASWLQVGFSSFNNTYNSDIKGNAYDLKLIKIAPMFSFAVNDKFAIDASIEVAPTFMILTQQEPNYLPRHDNTMIWGAGVSAAPGLRARYSIFALGFDYSFGKVWGAGTYPDGHSSNVQMNHKISNTRIYLGFQF